MLPGFKDLHPHQEEEGAQGALELMWRLQEILEEVAGLDACSLQPAAGSQGELTGLMLMRAYFEDRGEGEQRDTIITADTAHGTNPASVTMAGYKLEKVATDARGNLDVDDLRAKVNERTAGLMLTNPSTLGLFDEHIEEVAAIFHDAGSLLYYDGANLNAVCGISRPGDMGFDIVHINLHKTFSQPHGGGGPGGGPIVVRETLEPFLPVPAVVRTASGSGSTTTGRSRSARCAASRARSASSSARTRTSAPTGPALREMSEAAVLNANYLLARLRDAYDLPYDRLAMHEFVLSARTLKREHGVTALDVAKRLMDYGFHPPTIYFPLVVPEALMIEPTETEPKERLDAFVDAMLAIAREAAETPELLKEAPTSRPVRRLDEVKAAKRAVVKYGFEEHPDLSEEAGGGPAARGAEGRMTVDRADLERRVDELAEQLSGRLRERDQGSTADLTGDEEELLKGILLERGANLDQAVMDRVDARGWFRRQWDKAGGERRLRGRRLRSRRRARQLRAVATRAGRAPGNRLGLPELARARCIGGCARRAGRGAEAGRLARRRGVHGGIPDRRAPRRRAAVAAAAARRGGRPRPGARPTCRDRRPLRPRERGAPRDCLLGGAGRVDERRRAEREELRAPVTRVFEAGLAVARARSGGGGPVAPEKP